ncbi:c-type cytochrome biogenesis protein CcmI [Psychromonas sp. KJ10-2]|uniref:c-type cytochrome biogenesis protein CcmI n=1 Tax=Psychromonas sp. KJ10-2 TaxID=3391822 RepID=UPI0039B521DE
MITQLVIAIALMLLLFSILILLPFIANRKSHLDQRRRNQLNHDLYDIRLKEVEADLARGVVSDQQSIVAELQYNLLDDIDEQPQLKNNNNKILWLPGIIFFSSLV